MSSEAKESISPEDKTKATAPCRRSDGAALSLTTKVVVAVGEEEEDDKEEECRTGKTRRRERWTPSAR